MLNLSFVYYLHAKINIKKLQIHLNANEKYLACWQVLVGSHKASYKRKNKIQINK